MRPFLVGLVAVLPIACTTHGAISDSSRELGADPRFAHASNGDIIYGPSYINQSVVGQRDASGNVHVATASWFFNRADELSCGQAKLAELAMQRTCSADVQRMASQLAADQKDLCFRVEWTAKQQGLKPERLRDQEAIYAYQRLAAIDSASFDRAYVTTALEWQRRQLALWDDVLKSTTDTRLAQFALDSRLLLRADHAIAARQLDRM